LLCKQILPVYGLSILVKLAFIKPNYMLKVFTMVFFLAVFSLAFAACKKSDSTPDPVPNPCANVTVTVNFTKFDAISGQTNGSITVISPVGSGYTYSINNGIFQASTNFNNLASGTYTITAKTDKGCTGNVQVSLNGYGSKYHAVKQIILGYCGPCHLNGGANGGRNFDTDANIVAAWDRIKARTVDGIPSFMPEGGQLTTVDKQKITDWVNAGHTTTN
jgi:hypothetical protein